MRRQHAPKNSASAGHSAPDQSRCLRSSRISISRSWPKSSAPTAPENPASGPRRTESSRQASEAAAQGQGAASRRAKKAAKPKPWTAAEVYEAFDRFRNANPEPKGELEHLNPYHAAGRGGAVGAGDRRRRQQGDAARCSRSPTPREKMLELGEDKVRDYIKTIGLYRNKAKNVIALSEKLIAEFGGEVPRTRAEIESLPGAGRKTAQRRAQHGLWRAHHGGRHPCLSRRQPHGLAPGKTPLEVELGLEKAIPSEFGRHAHHWLILHGRYTCLARKRAAGST